jgi:hypothetical protein
MTGIADGLEVCSGNKQAAGVPAVPVKVIKPRRNQFSVNGECVTKPAFSFAPLGLGFEKRPSPLRPLRNFTQTTTQDSVRIGSSTSHPQCGRVISHHKAIVPGSIPQLRQEF